MEIPAWNFGNEKRFSDFISGLDEGKLILVSHTDMDGISSAKIANEALAADDVFFINYPDINANLVQVLKEREAKKVVFTDLFFKNIHLPIIAEIEKFAEILVIDHHTPECDINSSRTTLMNVQGYCAAYLAYYLFSKIRDLSHFDWLVVCASLADIAYQKNVSFMTETMAKYGDKFETSSEGQARKSGRFWDYQWKISLGLAVFEDDLKFVFNAITRDFKIPEALEEKTTAVENEYNSLLNNFEKQSKFTGNLYFWELNPKYKITSFLINEFSFRQYDKTFIFLSPTEKGYKFSARRQDGKVDLNKFCQELVNGFENSSAGGHPRASAGNFPKKYLEEFKKRLKVL